MALTRSQGRMTQQCCAYVPLVGSGGGGGGRGGDEDTWRRFWRLELRFHATMGKGRQNRMEGSDQSTGRSRKMYLKFHNYTVNK